MDVTNFNICEEDFSSPAETFNPPISIPSIRHSPSSEEWTTRQIGLIIIFGVITLVTIIANSFVLYIFISGRPRFRTPTNLLLANLAVADLLVGVIIMPCLATETILDGRWIFGDIFCHAWDYIHFLLCGASMWSMIGVGVDRYIGVSQPLQYKQIITRNKTIFLIMYIWLTATCLIAVPLANWPKVMSGDPNDCWVNTQKYFLIFIIVFVYWIPISGTMIIYLIIYQRATSSPFTKYFGVARSSPSMQKSEESRVAKLNQTRLAKNISVVTGAIFIFYAPLFMSKTVMAFDLIKFDDELLFITRWIRYCCSTVNPFMYGLAVPSYRKEIREKLMGRHKRGQESSVESSEL